MAPISRARKLYRKAEAALFAGIEIYNKPDFKYREECFSILVLNAWELLLKAKLLLDAGNDPRCLYVYEPRTTAKGKRSKKLYVKRNRSGNVHTLGLGQVITKLNTKASTRLPRTVKANLDGLTEIRDNAVHFINAGPQLAKRVLELGNASVKNFVDLAKRWFDADLTGYNLYIMPIGFVTGPAVTAIPVAEDEGNLLSYLSQLVQETGDDTSGLHVALEVSLAFQRVAKDAATAITVTTDPDAPKVQLSEEDIRQRYPWDYAELNSRLRQRYVDFKLNKKYYAIRKPLMQDPTYVYSRYLDPARPRGIKKDFYNPNILREFDKHYTQVNG